MNDPTDKDLLRFVAEFAGWTDMKNDYYWGGSLWGFSPAGLRNSVPDYLNSVDAWLWDVLPKMDEITCSRWLTEIDHIAKGSSWRKINASARGRCLSLYRACGGVVPERKDGAP